MREHFGFVSPLLKASPESQCFLVFAFPRFQLPPALDKYKSMYRKDFCWQDDYHSPTQAHVPVPCPFPALDPQPRLPALLSGQLGTGMVPRGQQEWVLSALLWSPRL